MTIETFQKQIEAIYYTRDAERGVPLTFTWFVEEVGELAKEIRKQPQDIERLREEFADVFAWLATLASLLGISLGMPHKSMPKAAQNAKTLRVIVRTQLASLR